MTVLYLDVTASVDRAMLPANDFKAKFPDLNEDQNRYYFCKLAPGSPKINDLPPPLSVAESKVGVLLCYSRKYEEFVDEIYDLLALYGGSPWQDTKSIGKGDKWPKKIDEAFRQCKAVWVFLGPEPGKFQDEFEINTVLALKTEFKFDLLPVLVPPLTTFPDHASVLFRGINYSLFEGLRDVEWLKEYLQMLGLGDPTSRVLRKK